MTFTLTTAAPARGDAGRVAEQDLGEQVADLLADPGVGPEGDEAGCAPPGVGGLHLPLTKGPAAAG